MTFGEKLHSLRKAKRMTQEELAKLSGIHKNTIVNYEAGKTYPHNRETYQILADIFEVDVRTIRNEDEEFIISSSENYGIAGANQAESIIKNFSGLMAGGSITEEDKDVIMRKLQEIYWDCKADNKKKYGKKS